MITNLEAFYVLREQRGYHAIRSQLLPGYNLIAMPLTHLFDRSALDITALLIRSFAHAWHPTLVSVACAAPSHEMLDALSHFNRCVCRLLEFELVEL